MENDFAKLRALSGMSQRKFADYFGIPRRTIEEWDVNNRECKPYIIALMRFKLEQDGIIPKDNKQGQE